VALDVVEVEAAVIGLTHDGHGIADVSGERIFVPGALPGETALLSLRRRRRRYREASVIDVIESVADRVIPACPYFGRCGGCAVQHMSYSTQLDFKTGVVVDAIERIGGASIPHWLEPITGPQWHYRRRARLGVRFVPAKQRVLVGFKERASRFVTDMASCVVLVEPMDRLPQILGRAIEGTSLRDRLPQAEIAVGDYASAIVYRVLDTPTDADVRALVAAGAEVGADVYLQSGGPSTVQPVDPKTARVLSYRLDAFDVELRFAPTDFVQVNEPVNAAIVARVIDLLELDGSERVLDLYCGLGNFSLPLARRAASVVGIEGDAGLVARAAMNATSNGIDNAHFVTADLSRPDWPFLRESWDVVVLDPPRSGAAIAVEAMQRLAPRRIAYVSCHPATLARDAKTLLESGRYRLTTAGIADMFPNTHHVEAIAVFDRCER
jgi:23S rRNA (uracil1939-C5)-methyltransferase